MSSDRTVYVGPYLDAKIPEDMSLYETCEAVFGDGEKFSEVYNGDRTLVLPNIAQSGLYVPEFGNEDGIPDEYEIPFNVFNNPISTTIWCELITYFEENGIEYSKRYGIVNYWS